jgi:hypothetical protein
VLGKLGKIVFMLDSQNADGPAGKTPGSQQTSKIDVENAKGDDLRKEDVLFHSDGHAGAYLNRGASPEFLYCEGYLKGSARLSQSCLRE